MAAPVPTAEQLVDSVLQKARASQSRRTSASSSVPQAAPTSRRLQDGPARTADGRVVELVSRVLDGAGRFVRGTSSGLLRGCRKSRADQEQEHGLPASRRDSHSSSGGGPLPQRQTASNNPRGLAAAAMPLAEDVVYVERKAPAASGEATSVNEPSLLSSPWDLSATAGARSHGSSMSALSPVPWHEEHAGGEEPGGDVTLARSQSVEEDEVDDSNRASPHEPSSSNSLTVSRSGAIGTVTTGCLTMPRGQEAEGSQGAEAGSQLLLAEERQRSEAEVRDLKATIAELESRLQQQDDLLRHRDDHQRELPEGLEEAGRAAEQNLDSAEKPWRRLEQGKSSEHEETAEEEAEVTVLPSGREVPQASVQLPEAQEHASVRLRGEPGQAERTILTAEAPQSTLDALPTSSEGDEASSPMRHSGRLPDPESRCPTNAVSDSDQLHTGSPCDPGRLPEHLNNDRLRILEACMEETRRQLEVCLQTASRSYPAAAGSLQTQADDTAACLASASRRASPDRPSRGKAAGSGRATGPDSPVRSSRADFTPAELPDAHRRAQASGPDSPVRSSRADFTPAELPDARLRAQASGPDSPMRSSGADFTPAELPDARLRAQASGPDSPMRSSGADFTPAELPDAHLRADLPPAELPVAHLRAQATGPDSPVRSSRADFTPAELPDAHLRADLPPAELPVAHLRAQATGPDSPVRSSRADFSPAELPDAHLQSCLLMRSLLANTLDPPELLQKAQAMMHLKAAVGEIYAVLCLQTKAKSFLAQLSVAELARRRKPRPQTASSGRPTANRNAVCNSMTSSSGLERRMSLEAAGRRRGDETAGVTARRRWTACPRPESVPPLALEFVQFGERLSPKAAPALEAMEASGPAMVSDAAACGSAISAARSLMVNAKPTRPMSSPALYQPRVVASVRPRQIKSAVAAKRPMPCRSRPASGLSRRKAGGWEPSNVCSQAELWLIKQRTLAGMLWPPMSEAARGRRPKSGCARRPAHVDNRGLDCRLVTDEAVELPVDLQAAFQTGMD